MTTRTLSWAALVAAVAVLSVTAGAQRGAPNPVPPNFDIRLDKAETSAAFLASARATAPSTDAAPARATGIARLLGGLAAEVEIDTATGVPEIVSARPGGAFLTGASTDRVAALRGFVGAHADVYGIGPRDAEELVVVADYMNPAGNMGWAELEQRINGLAVFQGYVRGGFTARGELVRTTGLLAAGLDASLLPTTPSVSAAQAVSLAAASVGWNAPEHSLTVKSWEDNGNRVTFDRGVLADDAKAWLLYFPVSAGAARLAWATEIWGDPDVFLTLVDAATGTILFRKNLTSYQAQPVTYNVYSSDSPAPSSPTPARPGDGFHPPFVQRVNVTLIGNEAPNTFNALGWIADGNNTTDGNNVEAGLDRVLPNGVDQPVTGSAPRVFNFAYNPETDNPLSPAYQNGDVTNLFYWTNRYHDAAYLLGFTEAARNFQHDNFGRGGVGGDRISAEAQDVSISNNANFTTPADGGRGRMQMSNWTGPAPDRSGSLDQDVVYHELTHGLSSRLHGNGSGLGSEMARGMSEGWSDFYARSLLSTADEDINGVFALGGWATSALLGPAFQSYYYGIRRFPLAIRSSVGPNGRPHNPLTLADIDPAQIDLTDGAFPPAFDNGAFVSHNIGEVWSNALLEVRARFIARLGHAEGNRRILQFVTDAMKLEPLNPTIVLGRDAILIAAAASGTGQDQFDIWSGFAARGIGASAVIVNQSAGTVVEAFDLPGMIVTSGTLIGESVPNGGMDPGEFVTVSLCASNSSPVASAALTATLLPGGGVVAPSVPQALGVVQAGATVCRPYSFTVSAACGAAITATLQVAEAGAATRSLTYVFFAGLPDANVIQSFDGVAAPALPPGWTTSTLTGAANTWLTQAASADTPPNRAFTGDPGELSDNVLVSPGVFLPAGISRLIFRNNFDVEANFDGGVLEMSLNGGAFQDILAAGGSFVTGGYTHTLLTLNPLVGRQAWSGNSMGYITSVVTLPPGTAGAIARFRWRMTTDISVSGTGWAVDSIAIAPMVCAPAVPIAQPPQALVVDSVVGNTVRLRWSPPAGGLPATQYVVEGGVNPGQILASLPTGSTAPVFTFAAPTGAFFARVHTVSGGNKSGPSNEVPLFVNVPVAPSPPANLLGTANGSSVALAWKNTFEGGAPTSMRLDVTGTIATTISFGVGESFGFTGVPGGTYTLRLRAANAGGTSLPSNAVTLSFPAACSGVPGPPTNVLAYQVGSRAFVSWDPPAGGPAPTGYTLNVSGSFVGSFHVTGRAVSSPIGPGTYNISVVGTNPCGSGAPAPNVVLTVP